LKAREAKEERPVGHGLVSSRQAARYRKDESDWIVMEADAFGERKFFWLSSMDRLLDDVECRQDLRRPEKA